MFCSLAATACRRLRWLFLLAIALGIVRALLCRAGGLGPSSRDRKPCRRAAVDPRCGSSTVLIPAFNEARVIERFGRAACSPATQVKLEVIVIDDGSSDGTSEIVRAAFGDEPRVRLLTLENGGKARALNHGLALAHGRDRHRARCRHPVRDRRPSPASRAGSSIETIGAVAGNAKVGNRVNLVTRWQALEYITAQNLERRALARLNAITVVPGAVGAWRRAALDEVGGYPADTLAEDQDLTIAIQRAGWQVAYDRCDRLDRGARKLRRARQAALPLGVRHAAMPVEARPRSLRTGKPRGLALVGLPQAWLFQILLAAISPIIDLAADRQLRDPTDLGRGAWLGADPDTTSTEVLIYWLVFTAIDLLPR